MRHPYIYGTDIPYCFYRTGLIHNPAAQTDSVASVHRDKAFLDFLLICIQGIIAYVFESFLYILFPDDYRHAVLRGNTFPSAHAHYHRSSGSEPYLPYVTYIFPARKKAPQSNRKIIYYIIVHVHMSNLLSHLYVRHVRHMNVNYLTIL